MENNVEKEFNFRMCEADFLTCRQRIFGFVSGRLKTVFTMTADGKKMNILDLFAAQWTHNIDLNNHVSFLD